VAKVKSLVFQARSSLIESRRAREIPCQEIREQLATATGGVLRRGPLRRHIRACPGCAEFRDDVMRQRRALAAILPVVPTLGLKSAALSAIGIGGGGGAGGAAGGAAAGGGIASLVSSGAAVKLTAAAVMAGIAVSGGLVLDQGSKAPAAQAAGGQSGSGGQAWPAPPGGAGPGTRAMAARRSAPAQPAHARAHAKAAAKAPAANAHRGHARPATPGLGRHGGKQHHVRGHAHGNHGGVHTTAPTPAPAPSTPLPGSHGNHGSVGGHRGPQEQHPADHSGPPPYGNAFGYDGHPGQSQHSDGAGAAHDGAGHP
jgi:hypothetical protein